MESRTIKQCISEIRASNTEFDFDKLFTLYPVQDYQNECTKKCISQIQSQGGMSMMIDMPMGAGKTLCVLEVIVEIIKNIKEKRGPILIICK
jgi:superfamily II DNA or RNA helicase